jgi:DNA-binding MarR family transcriptional regulator
VSRDFVDWVIQRWSVERPELDVSSIAVVGRLLRIASLLEQRFEHLCREHGLSFWAFTVLTALRRAGKPYRLTPGQLRSAGMVSAAAVTKRITRLEELGLVERLPDPADRRGTLVGLTQRGLDLIDRLSERYLEEERAVIAALMLRNRRPLPSSSRRFFWVWRAPRVARRHVDRLEAVSGPPGVPIITYGSPAVWASSGVLKHSLSAAAAAGRGTARS